MKNIVDDFFIFVDFKFNICYITVALKGLRLFVVFGFSQ